MYVHTRCYREVSNYPYQTKMSSTKNVFAIDILVGIANKHLLLYFKADLLTAPGSSCLGKFSKRLGILASLCTISVVS